MLEIKEHDKTANFNDSKLPFVTLELFFGFTKNVKIVSDKTVSA